jgi:hypothetical protein
MKVITREALATRIRDVVKSATGTSAPALGGFALRSSAHCERGDAPTDVVERVRSELGEDASKGRILRFSIGGEGRMRDGINLKMAGGDLERYRKNPVVLWQHYRGPVGHSIVEADGERLRATVAMLSRELSQAYDAGFSWALGELAHHRGHAASMGFAVNRASPAPTEVLKQDPWAIDAEQWELMEWSLVKVPMDPDAISEARATGLDTEPLAAGFARMLDELTAAGIERSEIEAAWAAAAGKKPTVDLDAIRAALRAAWQR